MTYPGAMQTYSLSRPRGSQFWRKATCEQIDCDAWRKGWITRLPYGSELVEYILAGQSRRKFAEITAIGAAERSFLFEPGQACFQASEHRMPIEREPLYVVRGGTVQVATGRPRQFTRGVDWMDSMHEATDRVVQAKERG